MPLARATLPTEPAAASDVEAALSHEITNLKALDLHELRSRWRHRLRCPPTTLHGAMILLGRISRGVSADGSS